MKIKVTKTRRSTHVEVDGKKLKPSTVSHVPCFVLLNENDDVLRSFDTFDDAIYTVSSGFLTDGEHPVREILQDKLWLIGASLEYKIIKTLRQRNTPAVKKPAKK